MSVDQRVIDMLARKSEIDELKTGLGYGGGEGQFVQRQRWVADAVELLLCIEIKRHQGR